MKSSKWKILRRQMELLTEYSRTSGQDKIPECADALVNTHRELVKAERRLIVRLLVLFLGFRYLMKRIPIKGIQFIKR